MHAEIKQKKQTKIYKKKSVVKPIFILSDGF